MVGRQGEGEVVRGHSGAVLAVAFSPDGKRLLVGCAGPFAHLWELADGKELQRFGLVERNDPQVIGMRDLVRVSSVAFSADGKRCLTALGGPARSFALLWDAGTGKQLAAFPLQSPGATATAAFSPDGKEVLASDGKTVRVWDTTTKEVRQLRGSCDRVDAVAFSRDGKRLLAGTGPRAALWDAVVGQQLRTFTSPIGNGGSRPVARIGSPKPPGDPARTSPETVRCPCPDRRPGPSFPARPTASSIGTNGVNE